MCEAEMHTSASICHKGATGTLVAFFFRTVRTAWVVSIALGFLLWVLSYLHVSQWVFLGSSRTDSLVQAPDPVAYDFLVESRYGQLSVAWTGAHFNSRLLRQPYGAWYETPWFGYFRYTDPPPWYMRWSGIYVGKRSLPVGPRRAATWIVSVPYHLLVLVLCLPLAPRLVPLLRAQWRLRNRRCVECGYDLRASPGRCPECGTVPADAADPGGGSEQNA